VVVSNITGASARDTLTALVAGQRDPAVMAQMARSKLRWKIPQLTGSLVGHFDDHHALLIGGMLQRLAQAEASLKACDEQIAAEITPWAHQMELLQTISGIGVKTAQVFIAETGADMSRFHSAAHLAAWAGLAPSVHVPAGKSWSMGSRKGNKWLASMLVEGAGGGIPDEDQLPRRPIPPPRPPPRRPQWSRSRIRCSSPRSTCSNATSPTATSARISSPAR
jgi:transposase